MKFLLILISLVAASGQVPPDWLAPVAPHRVADNLYYVGSKSLASYLITTPQGNILINSSLVESVPLIQESIQKLGFKMADTKILLISHAHWDHCAGSAKIKALTHAQYMVMDADVPVVQSGGKSDFQYGNSESSRFPVAKVDRVLHDGSEVKLGGVTLVAHLTPGHTKGCTTWTMKASDRGKTYDVVIVGSPNVNSGYKLVKNAQYPQIAADYERTFRVLKSLPCDIFLGAHGEYYDMLAKVKRISKDGVNPVRRPAGIRGVCQQPRSRVPQGTRQAIKVSRRRPGLARFWPSKPAAASSGRNDRPGTFAPRMIPWCTGATRADDREALRGRKFRRTQKAGKPGAGQALRRNSQRHGNPHAKAGETRRAVRDCRARRPQSRPSAVLRPRTPHPASAPGVHAGAADEERRIPKQSGTPVRWLTASG